MPAFLPALLLPSFIHCTLLHIFVQPSPYFGFFALGLAPAPCAARARARWRRHARMSNTWYFTQHTCGDARRFARRVLLRAFPHACRPFQHTVAHTYLLRASTSGKTAALSTSISHPSGMDKKTGKATTGKRQRTKRHMVAFLAGMYILFSSPFYSTLPTWQLPAFLTSLFLPSDSFSRTLLLCFTTHTAHYLCTAF